MIHSPIARVLFTHVSRTGGTAITNCLLGALPGAGPLLGQHDALAAARPVLGATFDTTFKFAIVRNPWERMVSWYALLHTQKHELNPQPERVADPDAPHWRDFDAFLDSWTAESIEVDGVPRCALSQWGQLADADDRLLTDALGRFETLQSDATRLLARCGLVEPKLPFINPARHLHYTCYFSAYGRQLIAERLHDDVARFGYRFDSAG